MRLKEHPPAAKAQNYIFGRKDLRPSGTGRLLTLLRGVEMEGTRITEFTQRRRAEGVAEDGFLQIAIPHRGSVLTESRRSS